MLLILIVGVVLLASKGPAVPVATGTLAGKTIEGERPSLGTFTSPTWRELRR